MSNVSVNSVGNLITLTPSQLFLALMFYFKDCLLVIVHTLLQYFDPELWFSFIYSVSYAWCGVSALALANYYTRVDDCAANSQRKSAESKSFEQYNRWFASCSSWALLKRDVIIWRVQFSINYNVKYYDDCKQKARRVKLLEYVWSIKTCIGRWLMIR